MNIAEAIETRNASSRPSTGQPPQRSSTPTRADPPAQPRISDAATTAIAFMKMFDPDGWWNLVALDPDQKAALVGKTFAPGSWGAIASFIDSWNGKRNLYLTVNEPLPHSRDDKLNQDEIANIRALYIDIDPEKGVPFESARRDLDRDAQRAQSGPMPPSVTVDSGGGNQMFWLLAEKVDARDGGKDRARMEGRALHNIYGGDKVHSIDHLMRLPSTVNIPTSSKREAGRIERPAKILFQNDRRYTLDEFERELARPGGEHASGAETDEAINLESARAISCFEDLDPDLQARFFDACVRSERLAGLWGGDASYLTKPDKSRSQWRWHLAQELGRAAPVKLGKAEPVLFSAQDYVELVHAWPMVDNADEVPLREYKRDWGRGAEPAIKERESWFQPDAETNSELGALAAARPSIATEAGVDDASAPGFVRDLNKRHAFVMNKGKAFVANVAAGGEVTFSLKSAFFDRYANQLINDGRQKISKGELWWVDPNRAQFTNGVDFDPNGVAQGVFNMWRGFPAIRTREEGKCDLILRHIREVICSGVERDFEYLIRWLAHILQKPGEKPGVAVVLRGEKGTGKDTLGEYMGEILQHLYFMVADQTLVTGAFNNHMTGKLLLHVQEAIWAGNKQAESALKSMITAPEMAAHPKGIDAFMVKSFMRVMMSSNEDWVVPASTRERRFFVLNVSSERIQSATWFDPIREEMRNGGPAAFARYLRAIDLAAFDVRRPHKTDALREQQQASLTDFALFWSELIEDSSAFPGENGGSWEVEHARVKIDDLTRRYDDWRKHRKYSKHVSREEAGRLLKDYTRGEVQTAQATIDGNRVAVRVLPPAARCRVLWGQRCAE